MIRGPSMDGENDLFVTVRGSLPRARTAAQAHVRVQAGISLRAIRIKNDGPRWVLTCELSQPGNAAELGRAFCVNYEVEHVRADHRLSVGADGNMHPEV